MRLAFIILLATLLLRPGLAAAEGEADQIMTIDQDWSVTVDGQTKTWKPFEQGTAAAWQAYLDGEYAVAVPVFRPLAELGHPIGQWLMGIMYYQGQGVPKDMGRAFDLFKRAAEQGYFRAFAPLAKMYEAGEGTPKDLGRAYGWYNIAIAKLPNSKERNDLIRLREMVAAQMTRAQIEAAQKTANAFVPKPVVPPDPDDETGATVN
jgi:hypothetical protein